MKYFKRLLTVKDTKIDYLKISRVLFGMYLVYYNTRMFPYLRDIFSFDGFVSDSAITHLPSQVFQLYINLRYPILVDVLGVGLIIFSLFFLFNYRRVFSGIYIITANYLLYLFNDASLTPDYPILLLLLCFHVIAINHKGEVDRTVRGIMEVFVWVGLGWVYMYAGVDKLINTTWQSGMGIHTILSADVVSTKLGGDVVRALPLWMFKLGDYGTILLELLFLPSLMFVWTRRVVLCATSLMWITALFLIDVPQFLLAALLGHIIFLDRGSICFYNHVGIRSLWTRVKQSIINTNEDCNETRKD